MEIAFLRKEKIPVNLSSLLSGKIKYFPLVTYQKRDFSLECSLLKSYSGIILCSKRSVSFFIEKFSLKELIDHQFYCVGERSKIQLEVFGIKKIKVFSSFLEMIPFFSENEKILYPTSNEYSKKELLKAKLFCSQIDTLICYKVVYENRNSDFQEWLNTSTLKAVAVLAPSQVNALKVYSFKKIHTFCMGNRTKQALENIGIKNIHLSEFSNLESLIQSYNNFSNLFLKENQKCFHKLD
ncbi:MAG: hypothetical protein COB02_14205 [Candidatus Cloacimonadota bacterium]|nr:MAG: hypothetical protein COB02_14205 [Candidatus Cloacimonadota bacterium]